MGCATLDKGKSVMTRFGWNVCISGLILRQRARAQQHERSLMFQVDSSIRSQQLELLIRIPSADFLEWFSNPISISSTKHRLHRWCALIPQEPQHFCSAPGAECCYPKCLTIQAARLPICDSASIKSSQTGYSMLSHCQLVDESSLPSVEFPIPSSLRF